MESGASNLFFIIKDKGRKKLITHPLDGCILPGITRDSILKLNDSEKTFKDYDVEVREFKIPEFISRFE